MEVVPPFQTGGKTERCTHMPETVFDFTDILCMLSQPVPYFVAKNISITNMFSTSIT